jgi:MFS family permease
MPVKAAASAAAVRPLADAARLFYSALHRIPRKPKVTAKRPEKRFFGLGRNVFVFGFVSLLNDFSSEITVRILPLFLSNVLGVKTSVIGLIEGIADSTSTLLKMLSGWLSDKVGRRKPLVLAGYALSALSKPLLFFARSWPFVLVLRFLDRVGKGVRTSPKDALIADSSSEKSQGRAFGYSRTMDPLGAVLGLLTAAGMIALGGAAATIMTRSAFRGLVLLSAIPALLGVVLVVLFIRDKDKPSGRRSLPSLSLRGYDRRFRAFLGLMVLFTLGNSSDAFLILRAQQLGLQTPGDPLTRMAVDAARLLGGVEGRQIDGLPGGRALEKGRFRLGVARGAKRVVRFLAGREREPAPRQHHAGGEQQDDCGDD